MSLNLTVSALKQKSRLRATLLRLRPGLVVDGGYRQTQRADLHYRRRDLPEEDVTIRDGLPATTPERTIADLVEDRTDLSIVADALRDAVRKSELDLGLLADGLARLAERNGHRKGDGVALLDQLLVIAGLDREAIAKQIASLDGIGELVVRNYLMRMPTATILEGPAKDPWVDSINVALSAQMKAINWTQFVRSTAALDTAQTATGETEA